MVKKKGSREMNPADAFRKVQRAKEIARNKKERKFLREAHHLRSEPDSLKKELEEVIQQEEAGKMNQTLRLKKRALQSAYDQAIKKRKEEEMRKKGLIPDTTLQTLAAAPPGVRPQNSSMLPAGVPLPKPPPLPAGPAPTKLNIPVPAPPAQPTPLPAPLGPPPGMEGTSMAPLPPPPGPPPGLFPGMAPLPPPPMPPPVQLPNAPPPTMRIPLPPPPGPPGGLTVDAASHKKEIKATITGAATAVKRTLAHHDKAITSMVPASVRIKRENALPARPVAGKKTTSDTGFGLAPVTTVNSTSILKQQLGTGGSEVDKKYQDFLKEMGDLGAFET